MEFFESLFFLIHRFRILIEISGITIFLDNETQISVFIKIYLEVVVEFHNIFVRTELLEVGDFRDQVFLALIVLPEFEVNGLENHSANTYFIFILSCLIQSALIASIQYVDYQVLIGVLKIFYHLVYEGIRFFLHFDFSIIIILQLKNFLIFQ